MVKAAKTMKYLPKSKSGLAAAGFYLLFAFALLGVALFAGGGPHGEAGTAFIYFFIVTLPLSAIVFAAASSLNSTPPNQSVEILVGIFSYLGLTVCALINASVIYLMVGFISRIISGQSKTVKTDKSGNNV